MRAATPAIKGFTLLELMLAAVLFAVGTFAVMELLHKGQAAQRDGEQTLIATHLAQRCLEELRNVTYANLLTASCTMPSGFTPFTYTVEVTNTSYTNLRQLVVTVSWSAPGGTASVSLQSYRSNV